MADERARIQSFKWLPIRSRDGLSAIYMARKGFYFSFFLQKVCCYKCFQTIPLGKMTETIKQHTPEACYRFSKTFLLQPQQEQEQEQEQEQQEQQEQEQEQEQQER